MRPAVKFLEVLVHATRHVDDLAVDERVLVVGDALDQVAVVAHEYERAGPRVEQALELGEHVGVEVVAGLVENQDVGTVEQDEHELQAAFLTAREILDRAAHLCRLEPELLEQLHRAHAGAVGQLVARLVVGAHLAHAQVLKLGELGELLREHGELDRLADLDPSAGRLELALDEVEQRRLASTVGTEQGDAVARADVPVDGLDEGLAIPVERRVLEVDDLLAQARHGAAAQLDRVAQRRFVRDELLGRLDPEARLARACLCPAREPRELATQDVLPFCLGDGRLTRALDALLDIGGVAALERRDDAVVHLPHVEAHLVEKPAVVRHDQKRALAIAPAVLEVLGEPMDAFDVEVVGGLVHHEHIPPADQHTREVDAAALPDGCFVVEVAHELVQDAADARISRPLVFGEVPHDGVDDRVRVVQMVVLSQHADGDRARLDYTAGIGLELAREHGEQRGLAVAVAPDDADAVARVHAQAERIEDTRRRKLELDVFASKKKRHDPPSRTDCNRLLL